MMPKTASAKRKPRRATTSAQLRAASPKLAIVPAADVEKKVRGVKLKTVSTLTMGFALLCLGAFMAGRPPVSTAGSIKNIPVQSSVPARHHPDPEFQCSGD